MKKNVVKCFICVSLACLNCICVAAQERYAIYKHTVGTKYQTKNNEWVDVLRKQPVSLLDMLSIPDNGTVTILDMKTNSLYSTTKSGAIRIKNLIDDAIKESSVVTSKLNEIIFEKINDSTDNNPTYAIAGAVYRGNNRVSNDIYVSICHFLKELEAGKNEKIQNSTDACSLIRHNLDDEEFYFSIQNSTSNIFFVNVLCITEAGAAFCFRSQMGNSISPMIGPRETIDFKQYPFVKTSNECKYLLIANTKDFKTSDIEMLLNNNIKLQGEPSSTTIVVSESLQ